MAQKSHGSRHGTRQKFAADGDTSLTVNDQVKQFEEGEKVLIDFHPSVQQGRVHSRFHGRHAEVTGKQGRAFELEIEDAGKTKTLYLRPVHLSEVDA